MATVELDVEIPDLAKLEISSPNIAVTPSSGESVLLVAVPGQPGPPGPPGVGGYTHIQSSPAATWTITHSLGRKPSSVSVWIADALADTDVEAPDLTTVVLTFSSPESGRAEII